MLNLRQKKHARDIRLSKPEGRGTGMSKHKGGSKSGLEYAIEFAKEKGVTEQEVAADVFEILHKSKDGNYDCKKARCIARRMEDRIQALSQPDPDTFEVPTTDRSKIFVVAVGGLDKRKRLFSANYMANNLTGSSSSVGTPSQSSVDMLAMKKQIAKLAADRDVQNEMMPQLAAQLKAAQEKIDSLDQQCRMD